MCGQDCAPSINTAAPNWCALSIISLIGLMVPNAFETWFTNTSFVLFESSLSYSSIINSPSWFMGITFKTAPVRSHNICQGTIFEWCSIAETINSSPFCNNDVKPVATMLMLCVVPAVKIIS